MASVYRRRSGGPDGYAGGLDGGEGAYYEAMPAPSGRAQIENLLDLLYRRRWLIILAFLVVAGSVAAYTYTLEPEYEAASFVILDLQGRRTTTATTTSPAGFDDNLFARNDRTLMGEIQLLYLSDSLHRRVHRRLQHEQETNPELAGVALSGYPRFEPEGRDGNNIIRITGVSTSPREAMLLANLYAEEYVHLTQEASRAHITAARKLLEEQEQKRLQELQEAEASVQAYLSREGAVGLDQAGSYLVQKIAELEAQRDAARIDLQTRRASLQVLKEELSQISPRLVQRIASNLDEQLRQVRAQLTEKELDLENYLRRNPGLSPDDPRLAPLNQDIRRLRNKLDELSQQYFDEVTATGGVSGGEAGLSYVTNLRQQVAEAEIAISELEAKIGVMDRRLQEYQRELRTIPQQAREMTELERRRQYAEQMYAAVVSRLQDVRVTEESEPGYARVLRVAKQPAEPVRPDRMRYLVLGLFFGLLAGLGLAIVRDKLDNRFFKPEQLRHRGYKVLGTVPDLRPMIKEEARGKDFIERDGQRLATGLVTLLNPMSPVVESYRHLRTNIQFSRPDVVVETIVVTSASVEEGKSTTAANLAVVMAEAGRRTVLIDADLRRPRIHQLFGLEMGPGLAHFLARDPAFDERLVRSKIDNLWIVPAGKVVSRSSELFATRSMRDLLETLRAQFDVIIIDTPPVRVATDAALLATQSDLALLVVRAGHTKEGEFDFAVESLESVGTPTIGTVLNGFNVSMAYGYKYRFRHYDRYAQYTSEYGTYGYRDVKALTEG
ncbi:polysaccharide biosynthesis tyrosine autokinase [Rhodocaloribacter litoris]|uniref:polysaccharide biosynthesis tyrosine autokinase n=1 Tax=Rhodocaloribacter litoris TaxID=2558931 RepID=UPI0014241E91|nr:polysaccharide biosynthesis tyrosine autokinase [Rhodocaloribacter litoris]QXD16218.1 polysaccharide biosynthesis tyrosine autokinase [Rhodocaloribacter litoris]GIV60708.1 MAG: hypothetical protein KatS3mg043_1797 [Rhodothermaceae bacterium]